MAFKYGADWVAKLDAMSFDKLVVLVDGYK